MLVNAFGTEVEEVVA